MKDIIKQLRDKAKRELKTIVLPEGNEQRVQQAIKIIQKEKLAKIILLDENNLEKQRINELAEEFYLLRKHRGITLDEAKSQVSHPLYYAAMMTRLSLADGFVAGAGHTTPDVARAAIRCLGVDSRVKTFSSSFIMVVPNCNYGEAGVFVFADCGIVPEPTAQELANIAVSTAELARQVLGIIPRVAMLSYSTKGSAKGSLVDKVVEATKFAKALSPDLIIDGELQADSAIVPEVARIKNPEGIIQGDANVLIFPDLEAGNIGYKLVNRLAKARAIGPLMQGLNKPCSDLSRGCSVEDIIDCVAVTAIRAQRSNEDTTYGNNS